MNGTAQIDVAVIGASIAGSSTALHLEEFGLSYAVFDQDRFPRVKVCGEGLSVIGLRELQSLGLGPAISAASSRPFFGFDFVEDGRRSTVSFSEIHGIGIRRFILDQIVLDALPKQRVQFGVRPQISRGNESFIIDGGDRRYEARFLVLATGGKSLLPEQLAVPSRVHGDFRVGLRVDVAQAQCNPDAVTVFLHEQFQACLTPIDRSALTISFMTKQSDARCFRTNNIPSLLAKVLDETRVSGVLVDTPRGISGIGKRVRAPYFQRIFCVGDAIEQLDPIGGMGMSQALITGRLAATAIHRALTSSSEMSSTLAQYACALRKELGALRGYSNLSYFSLVHPIGRKTLGRLKTSKLAKNILADMHNPTSSLSPLPRSLLSLASL